MKVDLEAKMQSRWFPCALALLALGCSSTVGTPVDRNALGYRACVDYFDCGEGRYCTEEGTCFIDCRNSADCALFGNKLICNRFGQCLEAEGRGRCGKHEDCGPGRYCNGVCSISGATCGSADDCPYDSEECEGKCAAPCGRDDDCKESCLDRRCTITNDICDSDPDCVRLAGQECTPAGQCMSPGWERWIPPGKILPTRCNSDDQCKALGWRYFCDCDKSLHRSGREFCAGGGEGLCLEDPRPPDLGGHPLAGVWGMRMEIGTVTVGVPLVTRQNTYSSNLFLVELSGQPDGKLKMRSKTCEIQLINFRDDDRPFDDLAWMLIPHAYLRSLPLLVQEAAVSGSDFTTSQSLDVRGCILADAHNDPLPTRHVYNANPKDPIFWDQDQDGQVAMTTMMDGVLRGQIYNVQRWKAVYGTRGGEVVDADHIRGLSSIENEMFVISASTPALIYDTQNEIHADESRTFFRLMRLDHHSTCADLIRAGHRSDSWLRHTNHLMDLPDP